MNLKRKHFEKKEVGKFYVQPLFVLHERKTKGWTGLKFSLNIWLLFIWSLLVVLIMIWGKNDIIFTTNYAFLRKNPENNIWKAMAGAARLMAIPTLLLAIESMWPFKRKFFEGSRKPWNYNFLNY